MNHQSRIIVEGRLPRRNYVIILRIDKKWLHEKGCEENDELREKWKVKNLYLTDNTNLKQNKTKTPQYM